MIGSRVRGKIAHNERTRHMKLFALKLRIIGALSKSVMNDVRTTQGWSDDDDSVVMNMALAEGDVTITVYHPDPKWVPNHVPSEES